MEPVVQKSELPLKRMFDTVPQRYDLLNRLLTWRLDERWRALAAARCLENEPLKVLDLCCGTGDLAIHIARLGGAGLHIIGLDFSPAMLQVAREKAIRLATDNHLSFVEGDAANMAFPDSSIDCVGTAFAFRNLTWRNPLRDGVLSEVLRILKPGGRFVIVETSQPEMWLLQKGFHTYLGAVVAPLGNLISGNKGAYRYLAESARNFYPADQVCGMLRSAGFVDVQVERLMGAVAAIHVAHKSEVTIHGALS